MRSPVSFSRNVVRSFALAASIVVAAGSVEAASVQTATTAKTAPTKKLDVAKKTASNAKRHRRHGKGKVHGAKGAAVAAKPAKPLEAKGTALAVAPVDKERPGPTAVAIVDATPLRFSPRADDAAADAKALKAVKPESADAVAAKPTEKSADEAVKVAKDDAKPAKGKKGAKNPKKAPKPPCLREAVHLDRFEEKQSFSLLTCEGTPAPFAIEHLSIMARPGGAPVPPEGVEVLAKRKGDIVAPGIKRLDSGLLERLQAVVDKLRPKAAANLSVISGYRPASKGSLHAEGQAIDFSLAGASNVELVDACKTLDDTGCGFYPNSSFIHMDVRPKGAGHVSWIDASGPGEDARYVSAWPLSPNDARRAKAAQGLDLQERQGREWHQIPTDERRGVAASTAAPIAMPDEPSDR
jgi:hypothetical protein